MDNVKPIHDRIRSPREIVKDLIEMLPTIEHIAVVVHLKDRQGVTCSWSNCTLQEILLLAKVLDIESTKCLASSFEPGAPSKPQ